MNGTIFNIQKFCINDGPGIRTTVFLKGCPLRCAWCHNPESQSAEPEFMFYKDICTHCGKCAGITAADRDFLCPAGAKEICGKELSADEVIREVLKDKVFYDSSGGGLTLSGGEPLFQFDFAIELLKKAKENGIHTAVETCGFTNKPLDGIIRCTDLWLYDIKVLNGALHQKYTGVSNEAILKNLDFLDGSDAKIILRCPIIPMINMTAEHFSGLAALSNSLKNVEAIHIEPYHPLGVSKSEQLGRKQIYKNSDFLTKEALSPFAEALRKNVSVCVEVL